jgi:flagellar protein FlbD
MIRLTRLNDRGFVVNADLVKFVEETPDTLVTLTTGDKIMVKEEVDDVIQRVVAYQRSIRTFPS